MLRSTVSLLTELDSPETTPVLQPQTRHYRAKTDSVSPASHRTTFEREPRCFLGVSLENTNFSHEKLLGMLEWIARRYVQCTVLIGDSIHRLTLEATRGLAAADARREALRLGQEFLSVEQAAFAAYASTTAFSFVTCAAVQATSEYASFYERLFALFTEDESFRSSVERFACAYHEKHGPTISPAERAERVRRSCQYFLEEFAIFACLAREGVKVMVYPGSFSSLAEIAAGLHPGAPDELRELTVVSLKLKRRGS